MSMPLADDTNPTPVVTDPTPAEPAAAVEETPVAIHPSWQRALDDAAVPEMMRTPIIEQIRRTEAEYNKGIEKSRSELPEEWRGFLTSAQAAGADPNTLTVAWNAAQAIREDPIKFLDDFTAQVDKLVTEGKLTRAQGQQAKNDAAAEVSDTVSLESPEAARLAAVEAQLAAQRQAEETRQAEATQRQAIADANAYADQFMHAVTAALPTIGVTGDPTTDANAQQVQITIGRIADSMLAADQTNTLTPPQAIAAAVSQVATMLGRTVGIPAQPQLPVHGGGAGLAAPVAKHFDNEKDREAAMLEVGKQFLR